MNAPPTIALFPEASFGAALNCVGIAQELRKRGARPVFICHPGFVGVFAEYGFTEYHLTRQVAPDGQTTEARWTDFVTTHLPHFNLSPRDQLTTYVGPTWDAIVDTAIEVEDSLRSVLAQIRPNAVLLDNVIMFPAIAESGVPWVRVVSCAETEIPDARVPPYLSGLDPQDGAACDAFRAEYSRATSAAHKRYNDFRRTCGLRPLPDAVFLENSADLNLLLAPSVVRYDRQDPLPADRFTYLEGCVRTESPYDLPFFPNDAGPLVYTSFGSLGALDTELIQRLLEAFGDYPARFLVNVGGFLETYDRVPDNVHLGDWFPQPSVVAQCDLFIHHGGNNSFCEALFHGVPSLVMPYCWDGHDNAQSTVQAQLGLWMNRSDWSAKELHSALDALLSDKLLHDRLRNISADMKKRPGTQVAADAVMALLIRGTTPALKTGAVSAPY
ncbi:glycosyltransferase [Pseudooceanicola sp. C21-150M6]|uniref:glycosyltransferase n=1 Tax=Pseudooceanicola sp. C21-150M6 TaxID=3434355 RepID=UPI003D7F8A59